MENSFFEKKVCILGNGFTSSIAYKFLLKKYNSNDIIILQDHNAKDILTLEIGEHKISPIPIFPVLESDLYNSELFNDIDKNGFLDVSYTEVSNFDITKYSVEDNSLADFMKSNNSLSKWLCLSFKQWGEEFLSLPFSQIQSKIKNHYIAKNGNTRLGYLNGLSLYYLLIKDIRPQIYEYKHLNQIDYEKSIIKVDKKEIKFKKLISTIPINKLLSASNFKFNLKLKYYGSYFFYLSYTDGLNENKLIYDCDFQSDILRIFSIKKNILMVQLKEFKSTLKNTNVIINQVNRLVPQLKGLSYIDKLIVPLSYPVEDIKDLNAIKAIKKMTEFNIIPFGRFGQWEYKDLHELNWKKVK